MDLAERSGGLLSLLDEAMPHRIVPVLRDFLTEHAGADDVGVLLADYELRQLCRLTPRDENRLTVPVHGTDAGKCFDGQVVITEPGTDATVVMWVPLSLRAERLGVLELVFREQPLQSDLLRGLHEVALIFSYILVACGMCSDIVEVARRVEPLQLAAEMQWNLQPLRAFSHDEFAIAGQLIPAYEVGGDCFDYNVDAQHFDLASLDAMGHGVGASVLAGFATAVMRNVRRAGGGPVEQIEAADRELLRQFGGSQFVTALAMRLRYTDDHVEIVNAGHPRPWRVRDGRAEPIAVDPQLPAGLFENTTYRSQTIQLAAGDRLVLVSDGVMEAGAPGEEFGEDRLEGLLLATAHLTPHQCVGEVLHTLRSFSSRLHDDATVVCLDRRAC